jgi:hypothetical protein
MRCYLLPKIEFESRGESDGLERTDPVVAIPFEFHQEGSIIGMS